MIKEEIHPGETMADIGSDHGFLPIFLLNEGICPRAVITDISHPCLEKAKENVKIMLKKGDCQLRVGDGLQPLKTSEVDVAVMAGMGGLLMIEILAADLTKTKSISRYIFQPRSQVGPLRKWLAQQGMVIERERLVREKNRWCEILVVAVDGQKGDPDWPTSQVTQAIQWEVPPRYEDHPDPRIREYLEEKIQKEILILQRQRRGKHPPGPYQEARIRYLEEIKERWIKNHG